MSSESLVLLLARHGESQARSILLDVGTPSSRAAFERIAAAAHARRLMDRGMTRSAATYEVHTRYEVSLRAAWLRTGEALDLRPDESVQPQGLSLHNRPAPSDSP